MNRRQRDGINFSEDFDILKKKNNEKDDIFAEKHGKNLKKVYICTGKNLKKEQMASNSQYQQLLNETISLL